MESEMLLQQKGFKLTEGRMNLRSVQPPPLSPLPPPMGCVIESLDSQTPPLLTTPLLFWMAFICLAFHLAVNATLSRFSTLTTTCRSLNCLLPMQTPSPSTRNHAPAFGAHVQLEQKKKTNLKLQRKPKEMLQKWDTKNETEAKTLYKKRRLSCKVYITIFPP